jgi:glyoxylase-like metal-dependent hydrolase (beta-lactamase superfamily II)
MKVTCIDAGNFKLDGGAMFGIIPKVLWQKKVAADENNLCTWKMRCLLIEEEQRLTLIDTGMGDKQSEKWQSHYYRHGYTDLQTSLAEAGYTLGQVTDVILSHLHFDHCGGALSISKKTGNTIPTFPNAKYWLHSEHWHWALQTNPKEKGTFLAENIHPLQNLGLLKFIDKENDFSDNWDFFYANGHTEKMVLPIINYLGQKIAFGADLIPSHAHIHIPFVMAYDNFPLQTMAEKEVFMNKLIAEQIILVFDHDEKYEAALLTKTEGKYEALTLGNLNNFLA